MNFLFASTARGLEELLKAELEVLGAQQCNIARGGVRFQADLRVLYHSLLWSRLASRILLPLHEFTAHSESELYQGVQSIDWPAIFTLDKTFMVHFNGLNEAIRNSQYGALRVKDAIADKFMSDMAQRPSVAKQTPDIRISVVLRQDRVAVALDLSGESLHQRGYRYQGGQAPLKENLAAAIVLRSGWKSESALIDPLCGSGTLLIEAAMMAADCAPGLQRAHWGFTAWNGHDQALWSVLMKEARTRATCGLRQTTARFFGYDHDTPAIEMARANARRAGVAPLITFAVQDISQLVNPLPEEAAGTILSNPPYGERLSSKPALIALYSVLGRRVKQTFSGWRLSLFSASTELLSCLQLQADREFKAKNGPLDCVQKNYLLTTRPHGHAGVSSEIAQNFANRLRKNMRKLDKWAQRQGIECYRLYDAELSEYNAVIDRYGHQVVVQEYAAPKHIDAQKARQRLFDVINTTQSVLNLRADQLILKTRQRQKGKNQYQKLAETGEMLLVTEYNAKFWVNLTDYLDTGLFAGHRLVRQMLGNISRGKDFLNLFAYTGTASVYAGLGGARTTSTLDMSRSYLQWAEKNMRVNGLTGPQHRLIQADCLSWLHNTDEQFDVIFIDPPTFSNSKRMQTTFEVQRDHLLLMKELKRLLRPQGTLLFSNNRGGFKMDQAGLSLLGLVAEDISAQTQSVDFVRSGHLHHCWLVRHGYQ